MGIKGGINELPGLICVMFGQTSGLKVIFRISRPEFGIRE